MEREEERRKVGKKLDISDIVSGVLTGDEGMKKLARRYLLEVSRSRETFTRGYELFMKEYYRQLGLAGFFERTEKLTPFKLQSIVDAIHYYPFADDEVKRINLVLNDLGLKEEAGQVLKAYKDIRKVDRIREILRDLGYVGVSGGVILDLFTRGRGKAIYQILSRALSAGGAISLIPSSFMKIEMNEAGIRDMWSLDTFLDITMTGVGMWRGFSRMKNVLFRPEIARDQFFSLFAGRIRQKAIHDIANFDEVANRMMNRLREVSPLNFSFQFALSSAEEAGVYNILAHREYQRELLSFLYSWLQRLDDAQIDKLIKGKWRGDAELRQFVDFITRASNESLLEKLFIKYPVLRVTRYLGKEKKIVEEGGKKVEIEVDKTEEMMFSRGDFARARDFIHGKRAKIEMLREKKKKKGKGEGEGVEYEVVDEIHLTDWYVPRFSSSVFISYLKDGKKEGVFVPDFLAGLFYDEILEQGGRILKVEGPSLEQFSTREGALRILNKIKEYKVIDEKSEKELMRDIAEELADLKKRVYFMARDTDMGVFKFLDKLRERGFTDEDIEKFRKVLLSELLFHRIANGAGVGKLKNFIELMERSGIDTEVGHHLKMIKGMIEALEGDYEGFLPSTVRNIQNAYRRLWLIANVPVRMINTMTSYFALLARYLSRGGGIKGVDTKELIEFGRGLWLGTWDGVKKSLDKFSLSPQLSLDQMVAMFIRSPFEGALEGVSKFLTKRAPSGKKWGEILFSTDVDNYEEYLKAFLFAEGVFGKPTFFYYGLGGRVKLGGLIDDISAFFSANFASFYHGLKSMMDAGMRVLYGRSVAERILPIASLGLLSSTYAGLIGMRHTIPFGYFYELSKLIDLGREIVKGEIIQGGEETWYNIMSGLDRKLGLSAGLFGGLIPHVLIGSGILGGLLEIRTEAGAMTLPPIFDAPIFQMLYKVFEMKKSLDERLRAGEVSEAQKLFSSFMSAVVETSGILRKIRDGIAGQTTSIAYYPPQGFARMIEKILFPEEVYPFHTILQALRDKLAVRQVRDEGVAGITRVLGELRRVEREKGITFIDKNIEDVFSSFLRRWEKGEIEDIEDEVKSGMFLMLLYRKIKGGKRKGIEEMTYEDVVKVVKRHMGIDVSENVSLMAYFDKLKRDMKIGSALIERRGLEMFGG